MANTKLKGKVLFACFVAIIVTVFSCFVAFLAVTIVPLTKTHSNYYVLQSQEEESETPAIPGLTLPKTTIEVFFTGDKYYTKTTAFGSEAIKSDPEDYVIYDGRIYLDISRSEFDKLSKEEKELLSSYKIDANKLITEEGEFVCESNKKMLNTGLIGLGISTVLLLIVISMIVGYNRQMRAVSKEVAEKKAGIKQKVKALPLLLRTGLMLVLTAGLAVTSWLLIFGTYANHAGTYVTYVFSKTYDNEGHEITDFPYESSNMDSHKFYEDSESKVEVQPDLTITYIFKGKKLTVKTETIDHVSYEEFDYVIKEVGKDLEEKFGIGSERESANGFFGFVNLNKNGRRLFVGMTEKEVDDYLKTLKAIPANSVNSDNSGYYYTDSEGKKVYFQKLDEVSNLINVARLSTYGSELLQDNKVFGAYGTSYYTIAAIGVVVSVFTLMCLVRFLVLSQASIKALGNAKKGEPTASGDGNAAAPGTETSGEGTTSAGAEASDPETDEKVAEKQAEEAKALQKRQRIVFAVLIGIILVVTLVLVLL